MRAWPALWFLLLGAAGCGGGGGADAPPEIRYGLDECGHCRMIISEERFAAAARSDAGEARFDDVGCLAAYLGERSGEGWTAWVHEHADGGWLRASEAWFVHSPAVVTPMSSGWVAFAERERADRLAAAAGAEVRSWQELLADRSDSPPTP